MPSPVTPADKPLRPASVSRSVLVAVAAAALLFLCWDLWWRPPHRPTPVQTVTRVGPGSRNEARSAGAPALAGPASEAPSPLADNLNSAGGDIHADLRILNEVFRQFRSSTRGMNPVGENVDITAALTGRNSLHFAFISPRNAAINARGELCDRWGTPFFFHQLSGAQMEIHSAGPDRKLWTADDEILTPGLYVPQK